MNTDHTPRIFAPSTRIDASAPVRRTNLKRLIAPRHVAMVGGLGNLDAIEMLRASGFTGEIWPVHPTRTEIGGLPTFARVTDLPLPPDAAFLNVPGKVSEAILRDLSAMGAGGAICYSAGFAELGAEGRAAQDALVDAAGDLAVLGPNANGLLNQLEGVALWPVQSHAPRRMETGAAILSSSGGILFNYTANQRSVPAAMLLAMGNQAVLGFPALIDVLVDDPRITALGLFAEDIGDPVAFSAAAARAAQRGLPIVALKTGRSAQSAALAATHSGAILAPDDAVDALFRRCGVIRVSSLTEFDETLKMLTIPTPPRGPKMAVMTISGGEKALVLDSADGLSISFPDPSPDARAALETQIPDYASVSNPFDFNPYYSGDGVLSMDNQPALERCFETILADGYDIGMLIVAIRTDEVDKRTYRSSLFDTTIRAFVNACKHLGLCGAVTAVMPEHLPQSWRGWLSAQGIAPLMGLDDSLRAVHHAVRRSDLTVSLSAADMALPPDRQDHSEAHLVSEADAKTVLAAYDVVLPPSRRATCAAEAVAAAEAVGYPVALKVLEPVLAHKAKMGGVALALTCADEVLVAAERMAATFAERDTEIAAFLVEGMVQDAQRELIIGVNYEPGFGHMLILGHGGVEVEDGPRPASILLPVPGDALEQFVGSAPAMRGQNAQAKKSALAAIRSVAALVEDRPHDLASLDINPIILDKAGHAIAVDALLALRGASDA